MGNFCGYSEAQMLNVLHARCKDVNFEKANNNQWRLYCFSEEHGEFELEGTMTYILMQAFKPHKEWADQRNHDLGAAIQTAQQALKEAQANNEVVFADTAEDIETRLQQYAELNCPACRGSGHKDDIPKDTVLLPENYVPMPIKATQEIKDFISRYTIHGTDSQAEHVYNSVISIGQGGIS